MTATFQVTKFVITVSITLCIIGVLFAPRVQAQNTDVAAMQAQLAALMEMLASLQVQMNTVSPTQGSEGGFTTGSYREGDTIKTNSGLKVRTSPSTSGSLITIIPAFTTGTIEDGPRYSNGYTWWKVDYANGVTGWSAEGWFTTVSPSQIKTTNNSAVTSVAEKKTTTNLDPEITLLSPKKSGTFDKSIRNDDVVIKWDIEDVPDNTNVIIDVEAVQLYAGSVLSGGSSQVQAFEGKGERRIAIDSDGTWDPGEYKVRLSLEECHSRGCNVSYTFGPLKENLEIYDRSEYGYFTIVDGKAGSVRLKISGAGDVDEFEIDPDESVTVNYYPVGDIDECEITGEYDDDDRVIDHSWPNTILSGQYGRAVFSATAPQGILEKIVVECTDERGKSVAEDSIIIEVEEGEEADYEIFADGDLVEDGDDVTEAKAMARCSDIYNNEYRGQRIQCEWDGDEFFDQVNGKG